MPLDNFWVMRKRGCFYNLQTLWFCEQRINGHSLHTEVACWVMEKGFVLVGRALKM